MPAVISVPETKTFRLERLDARHGIPTEEQSNVTVKQATVRENSRRSQMFATIKTQYNPEDQTETRIYDLPFYDLIFEEIYLTLVGCNLTVGEEENPLFRFKKSAKGDFLDMTKQQFFDAIGLLDDDTLSEIHEKVLEANPHWRWTTGDLDLGEES